MALATRNKQDKDALDDLVLLDKVSEGAVMDTLKNRYMDDKIYTNIGPVLIAINPYKMIKPLYTDARIREYRGKKYYEMPPHVFALADSAYSSMINYSESQCVIISGESGAGKTETSKIFMNYISAVSGRSAEVQRVKDCMLSSNPVLEAFGNAKTVRNDNSSRFGKYMEILFDHGGDPIGGQITNYLLEKSRVVGPAPTERNFHIFYQVTKAASPELKEYLMLEHPSTYYYLSVSECYDVGGLNDEQEYKEMMDAAATVGFSEEENFEIHRIVAAVLWLGNVTFQENNREQSEVANPDVLNAVAEILEVGYEDLATALTTREITTGQGARRETYVKPLTSGDADFSRDTLAKALYSKMFDWVVEKVNESIRKREDGSVAEEKDHGEEQLMMGVLDIYGFEIFEYNSFEQLCINFVNEKLQQIFIELTLKAEQEEYVREGIPWKEIKYYNNKPVCQLIEAKPGVLSVLTDSCNTSKTDEMFAQDLGRVLGGSKLCRVQQNDFTVSHFAGDVRYEVTGFVIKNKDTLFDDLIKLVQSSRALFVRGMGWDQLEVSEGQRKRPPTVGMTFTRQVNTLMRKLNACVPNYIRCIKPNETKRPQDWSAKNCKRQVQYLGLLENIRVRRAGYAYRSEFDRFIGRYALLDKQLWSGQVRGSEAEQAKHLCRSLGWREGEEFVMGKTKIFVQRAASLFELEDRLDEFITSAVMILQKAYKKYKLKRELEILKNDAYHLLKNNQGNSKQRRRCSITRDYRGDYANMGYSKRIREMINGVSLEEEREKVIFADRIKQIQLEKKSLFGKLAAAFSKKKGEPVDHRFVILTNAAVYVSEFVVNPETEAVDSQLTFRCPVQLIESVTLSRLADNYMLFRFREQGHGKDSVGPNGVTGKMSDCIFGSKRKTEFLALLDKQIQLRTAGKSKLQLRFEDEVQFTAFEPGKKPVLYSVKWVPDSLIPENEDKVLKKKSNVFEIHVPEGMDPNTVPEPPRPVDYDLSNRPHLVTRRSYPGNGVDELGFQKGEILLILNDPQDGWWEAELNGQRGFVHEDMVDYVTPERKEGKKRGGMGRNGGPGGFKKPSSPSSSSPSAAGRGGGRGGGFKPPARPVGGKKKSNTTCDWVEKTDPESGHKYYEHRKTGESTWDPPQEFLDWKKAQKSAASGPVLPGRPGKKKASSSGRGGPGGGAGGGGGGMKKKSSPPPPVKRKKKKSAWIKHMDPESGYPYWENTETGESTWDKPADA